ncbi:MAG: FmdB family zinc ribbon protein [Thermoleophilia bacterium]
MVTASAGVVVGSGIRLAMLDNGTSVPFYEYRRPDGTILEVMQKMTDPPLTEDPETGVPLQRIFHPIAVHFKGKGFYNTDYGTKKRAREQESQKAAEPKSDAAATGEGSKPAPKADSAKAGAKDPATSATPKPKSKPADS